MEKKTGILKDMNIEIEYHPECKYIIGKQLHRINISEIENTKNKSDFHNELIEGSSNIYSYYNNKILIDGNELPYFDVYGFTHLLNNYKNEIKSFIKNNKIYQIEYTYNKITSIDVFNFMEYRNYIKKLLKDVNNIIERLDLEDSWEEVHADRREYVDIATYYYNTLELMRIQSEINPHST